MKTREMLQQELAELFVDLLEIKELTTGDAHMQKLFKAEVRMIIRKRIRLQQELAAME